MKTFLLCVIILVATCDVIYNIPKKEQDETIQFWTEDKLKQARPIEFYLLNKTIPNFEKSNILADTEYVEPVSLYQQYPYSTMGKLFFQVPGGYAYCSASATGNNALLTAAHCVFGDRRPYHSFMFVPQYLNQRRPNGTFTGRTVFTFEEFRNNENMVGKNWINFKGRDVAFIVTNGWRNKTLEETVGKLGIGSCDVGTAYRAFGYPRPDYGGEKLVRTVGDVVRRFPLRWSPAPIGIRSKMKQGSSGGPLIMKFQEGKSSNNTNLACSVNSFGIMYTYYVFGPFFDEKVFELRNRAVSMK